MTVKHFKLYASLVIVTGIVIASVVWFGRSKPVSVIVKQVDYGIVQDTVANTRAGTIKACRRAGISPSIGGQIIALPVKDGDTVKAGDLLMEFWNQDLRAQVELARSEEVSSRYKAKQACVLADVGRREADRLKEIQKKKLTSAESYDKAEGEAEAQQSACNAARAAIDISRAKLANANAALDRTRLTAPFAGTVAEINGEIGEFVTPSPIGVATPPAVDLIDTSCLYVSAPMDEVDAPRIRIEMPAHISLDAFPDQVFDGKVRRIAPYVLDREKQARTVDVEVDFLCPDECKSMLPGYSADIEVILDARDKVLRIPTEAVLEGNRVMIFTADSRLTERKIEAGLGNWAWTEVRKGLEPGEEVVTSVDREGVIDGAAAVREKQADVHD